MRIEPALVFVQRMCIIGMKKKNVYPWAMKGAWNAEHVGSGVHMAILSGITRGVDLEFLGRMVK
jgi:hypothetical protein